MKACLLCRPFFPVLGNIYPLLYVLVMDKKEEYMKKVIYFVLVLCMVISIAAGCAANTASIAKIEYPKGIAHDDYEARRELRQQNAVDESIINSINEFSAETASVILSGEKGNTCYSPISLYMALAMLSTGAKGQTQDELLALLGEDDTKYLSEQMGKLFRLTYVDNKIAKLYMTNSLWVNDKVQFNQEYIDNAKSSFYAASNKLNFSDPNAGNAISSWISDNTNGLLKPEIEVDPVLSLMFIVNTLYLKDEWEENFNEDATKQDLFYTTSDEQVNAEFMTRELNCENLIGNGFKAASLCLKNTGKMTFVLPDEGVNVSSLIESPESLAAMIGDGYDYGEVLITLPKFNFDTEFDLKESLETLGVKTVFDIDKSDLSGITDIEACVDKVKQGSNISINEDGVEAAAYTYIEAVAGCAMGEDKVLELNFNRPFIFIVQSNENVPLFIGVVQNPSE